MGEEIKLSQKSEEIIKELGYKREELVPLAFAVGLRYAEDLPPRSDQGGSIVPLYTICRGRYEALYKILIKYKFHISPELGVFKRLTDYGFIKMKELYENETEGDFLLSIYNYINFDQQKEQFLQIEREPKLFKINLGQSLMTREDLILNWNNAQVNQHLAIIGMPGSGKTQFGLEILAQICEQCPELSLVLFDYSKGDIADDQEFVSLIKGEVVDVKKQTMPFNPLQIPLRVSEVERNEFMQSFVDTVDTVIGLGDVQKNRFYEILKGLYETNKEIDVYDLYEKVREIYEHKPNKLLEISRQLVDFKIFPKKRIITDAHFFQKKWIFDIHGLMSSSIKELIVFVTLNHLYRQIMSLKDTPLAGNARLMRGIIFIDEAHNYLKFKANILEKIVREVRSKGIGVFLLSQHIDDFETRNYNFLEDIKWVFLLKSKTNKVNLIAQALNIVPERVKRIVEQVKDLGEGEALTKGITGETIEHFITKRFYQRLGE